MPVARTRSTSPGRGPKAIRLSTWTMAFSPTSARPIVAAGLVVTRTAIVNGRTNGRNRFICEIRQVLDPERLRNRHTILATHGRSCDRRRSLPSTGSGPQLSRLARRPEPRLIRALLRGAARDALGSHAPAAPGTRRAGRGAGERQAVYPRRLARRPSAANRRHRCAVHRACPPRPRTRARARRTSAGTLGRRRRDGRAPLLDHRRRLLRRSWV